MILAKRIALPLILAALCVGCAVPVPPTGGPPDQTPPALLSSEPASGSTNVSPNELVFRFSEAVDAGSFSSAFSITPDLSGRPEFKGSGKTMRVVFEEELRPNTTYIVTLDANLRDARRVALDAPITMAFATGDQIDVGRLEGRLVEYDAGNPASEIDVFAYADSDSTSLAEAPLYRTQTGRDGQFRFSNVAEGNYFIVGVDDANGNRRIDAGEAIAIPPVEYLTADSAASAPDEPWIVFLPDTQAPRLDRVTTAYADRLELRFSEPLALHLNDPFAAGQEGSHALVIEDSVGTPVGDVLDVWFEESRPRTLLARLPSLAPGTYRISGDLAVADSAGNPGMIEASEFAIQSGAELAPSPEFQTWIPDSLVTQLLIPRTIWPIENAGFRLNAPGAITISATDTMGQSIEAMFAPVDATAWQLQRPGPQQPFDVLISSADGDSLADALFRIASSRDTGALVIPVQGHNGALVIQLMSDRDRSADAGRPVMTMRTESESVLFDGLPAGFNARARFIEDADGNGQWTSGQLHPWMPAERVRWVTSNEPVRARWETVLSDTLSFDAPEIEPAASDSTDSQPR